MTIEDEIARALRDFLQPEGFEIAESDRIFAQRLSPLLNRVRAEALREFADRYQDEADWNTPADIDPELLRREAERIEQNSEGNEA